MLRVVRLSGDGQYYTGELTAPGRGQDQAPSPYADGSGVWLSPGATSGAAPPVEGSTVAWLLGGRDPRSGRPLPGRPSAVTGYDLTFSAAKSVSVLLALSDRPTASLVRGAHEAAVAAGVQYLRDRAVVARRRQPGARTVVRARWGEAAVFTHTSSRALDPHLHSHVVVANRAHGVDGRWSAVDGTSLWSHARAAGALYDAHLRHELSVRLGVRWHSRGPVHAGRYDIDGLDPLLLAGFSGRRAEILAERAHPSFGGRRASIVAWAVTRAEKEAVDGAEFHRRWTDRARGLGIGPPQLARALGHPPGGRAHLDEYRFAASLAARAEGPARRHVVQAWCDAIAAGTPAADVARCVDRLVGVGDRLPEPAQRVSDLVPTNLALRSLGPRPTRPAPLEVWLAAARRHGRVRPERPSEAVAPRRRGAGPGLAADAAAWGIERRPGARDGPGDRDR